MMFRLQDHLTSTGGGLIRKARPWRLMNLNGFSNSLGDAPDSTTGNLVKALASRWNREARWAIGSIAPERLIPDVRAQKAPWFTEELRVMKHHGRQLE